MNVLSANNQSFRYVVESIGRGIRQIFLSMKKAIEAVGRLINGLHDLIATAIQLVLNIASVLFVVFIPFALFLDPLNWSAKLARLADAEIIFWARMVLGVFFSYVVVLLLTSLWKALKESKKSLPDDEDPTKKGIVRGIANLMSWMIIASVFVYFTVFRMQLFGIQPEQIPGLNWAIDRVESLLR